MASNLLENALKAMGAGYKVEDDKLTRIHFALVKDNEVVLKDIIMESGEDVKYRLTMSVRGLIDIRDFGQHEYLVYVYATSRFDKNITQDSYKRYPPLQVLRVNLTPSMNDALYIPVKYADQPFDVTIVQTDLFKKRSIIASGSVPQGTDIGKAVGMLTKDCDLRAGYVHDNDIRIYCTYNTEHSPITDVDQIEHMPIIYIYDVKTPEHDVWQYEEFYNAFKCCEVS
jgi:hypothetical protein